MKTYGMLVVPAGNSKLGKNLSFFQTLSNFTAVCSSILHYFTARSLLINKVCKARDLLKDSKSSCLLDLTGPHTYQFSPFYKQKAVGVDATWYNESIS